MNIRRLNTCEDPRRVPSIYEALSVTCRYVFLIILTYFSIRHFTSAFKHAENFPNEIYGSNSHSFLVLPSYFSPFIIEFLKKSVSHVSHPPCPFTQSIPLMYPYSPCPKSQIISMCFNGMTSFYPNLNLS